MKIETNGRVTRFDIKITTNSASISEDLSEPSSSGYVIPEKIIEDFITAAFEMSRFNEATDIATVTKIADAFLTDSEKEELIKRLS